jgi:hypothetical protein
MAPAAAAPTTPIQPAEAKKVAPEKVFPSASPATATASASAPPPSGVSPDKEQRLYQLLQDYKADKLTPFEYHTQRAKILSEP